MKKTFVMIIMLICLIVLFGAIFGYKAYKAHEQKKFIAAHQVKISAVTATSAQYQLWKTKITAVGSTRTVKGVNVTTELGGMVKTIYFNPGADVKAGDLLVLLDISTDVAKLHALEASAKFAKITYDRNLRQYKIGAVSQEQLASDEANYASTKAQVEEQKATIAKKTIRAPFSGRLGISEVNPGQYLRPGDTVATLQTLNPIYIDFNLPQQSLSALKLGESVTAEVDAYPKETFEGKITTINPVINDQLRNVEVEATFPNTDKKLLPGMFASGTIETGSAQKYITLPQTAIAFNPYGNIAYILAPTDQYQKGQPVFEARQQFVNLGAVVGDQVAVLSGIPAGAQVVTSGQLKLKDKSLVIVVPDQPATNNMQGNN